MTTRIVETACGPVEYTDVGSGAPILYFHGTGMTGDAMAPIESQLVESNFRLLALNRPGYGSTPLANHLSASDCAMVAAALLDVIEISTTSVMGSSGGAAFATSFAKNYPQRTQSLVLMCPQLHRWDDKRWLPIGSRWTLPLLRNSALCSLLIFLYRIQFPRTTVDQFLRMEAGSRYPTVAEDQTARRLCRDALSAMANGVRQPGFKNDFKVFVNEDVIDDQSDFTTPTLLLYDPCDPVAPPNHVDWFTSLAPHSERVTLNAAGHLIWAGPDAAAMHEHRVRFLNAQLRS